MAATSKNLNTFDYLNMLFSKELKNIVRREQHNKNQIHLYGVGEYWVAFEKSAYLLEQMSVQEPEPTVLYLKEYPFPILMYSVHYRKVKDWCRNRTLSKSYQDYLLLPAKTIEPDLYRKWHRSHMDECYE